MKFSFFLFSSALSLTTFAQAESIQLSLNKTSYFIDLGTLETTGEKDGEKFIVSEPVLKPTKLEATHLEKNKASWTHPSLGLSYQAEILESGALEFAVTGATDTSIQWPSVPLHQDEDLIWPKQSGLNIPLSDSFWRNELLDSEWETLESLSMPMWAVTEGAKQSVWMASSSFRNTIQFTENDSDLNLSFTHHFHPKSSERTITFRFARIQDSSVVASARLFREWYDERETVLTLEQKAEQVPNVERLLGAPHIYLWGIQLISWKDIPPTKWQGFSKKFLADSEQEDSLAAKLKSQFTTEQLSSLTECVEAEWPSQYAKKQVAAGLSNGLQSEELNRDGDNPSEQFYNEYSEFLKPWKEWGDGASLKMMEALKHQGFEKLRLCYDGWDGIEQMPWVAEVADENGWLIGIYDSYHSIHDPALKGSEGTWPTAQMTPELWENAGIMKQDGTFHRGFKQKGKKVNPFAVRDYYEERISGILNQVPLNYYFIDCDAFGEVYDDYHPLHTNGKEEGAAERNDRLAWLSHEKGLVVGSEGGALYALNGTHIFEGMFGPYFGWGDEKMSDKNSEFYIGRYYPPEQPEIYFKPIPVQEKYIKQNYDPTVRIPLFQAAFHDAVITTHHWSNDRFKYPELKETVELFEILWMSPPMVHLNLDTVEQRSSDLKKHLNNWAPLHEKLGFASLRSLTYLTDDRMVQVSEWSNNTIIRVNFSDEEITFSESDILPPRSFSTFTYRY